MKHTLICFLLWLGIFVALPASCDKDLANEEARQQRIIKHQEVR